MGNEIKLRSIDDVNRVAVTAAESRLFGVRNVEEAAIKIMYGAEMGLPVLQALMSVHVIEGKPALSANLIAALVKRSGRYNYAVTVWDDFECSIVWNDNGKKVGESSFSMDDARRAGLIKPRSGWEKYPKAMTFSRALTQGARAYCADVFVAPIYTPEELGAEDNEVDFIPAAATVKPTVKPSSPFNDWLTSVTDDKTKRIDLVTLIYDRLSADGLLPTGIIDPAERFKAIRILVNSDGVSMDYIKFAAGVSDEFEDAEETGEDEEVDGVKEGLMAGFPDHGSP